jgi:GrpB-like predicted nucleotidyltransferase (UPF0157 family)
MAMSDPVIGQYPDTPILACYPYDPRAVEVARDVSALIVKGLPDVGVEHVGSTAVPGCDGKGIVDLMVMYPEGLLDAVRQHLDTLGFQRQISGRLFPEERPMRVGSVVYNGTLFRIHAHVVAAGSLEVANFRDFRDRLCADHELMDAYVAKKREIIASGVGAAVDYTMLKGTFIDAVLGDVHH